MDPRSVNGGVFLGLNGIAVKSHGGTDAKGFASAIDLGVDMARDDLIAKITEDLEAYHGGEIEDLAGEDKQLKTEKVQSS